MTNSAEVFSMLRSISGGKLTPAQVSAGDLIIEKLGIEVFAKLIGYDLANIQNLVNLNISENGYAIIREFEGCSLSAYKDTGGVWTIGFGTIKYPNGVSVKSGDKITLLQAESYLKNDCKWVDACLDDFVKVQLNQNQFDALASFVYNVGASAFKSSTLLVKLNSGDYVAAANQLDRWVNDNGKKIQGLINRRAKEKKLFLK